MEISICMMVKDEEKNIRRCLNSLKPILKNIDSELVIVDTGSKDKTVEISRKYTDKVYFHEWENDFSGMRNKTINYANGNWIFIIDADEEITNCNNIIRFLKSSTNSKFQTGLLNVKNMQNLSDDSQYAMLKSPRLFRNDGEFHYEGIVHNNPIFKQPSIDLETTIVHYGYIEENEDVLNKKFIRTSNLLKSALDKDPKNIYYLFQLSVTYTSHNDYFKGYEIIKNAYELLRECKDKSKYKYKYVYYQMALCSLKLEEDEIAKSVCEEGLDIDGEYIDLIFYLGKAKGLLEEYEGCIKAYQKYIDLCDNYNNMNINFDLSLGMYTLGQKDEALQDMIKIYFKLEKFDEVLKFASCIERNKYIQNVLELIISSAISCKNINYIKHFYEEKIMSDNQREKKFFLALEKYCGNDIYKLFSSYNNDYSKLYLLRYKYNMGDSGFEQFIENISFEADFNILENYFGDVLYFKLKYSSSLFKLLENVWDKNINRYLEYISKKYEDFSDVVVKYINDIKDDMNYENFRINKILCRYILLIDKIDDFEYEWIFKYYLDIGIKLINYIYNEVFVEQDYIDIFKNQEEKFMAYMNIAMRNRKNDKIYIHCLRKSLEVYPYMKRGIEVLLNDFKEKIKSNENNNEFENYRLQIKQTIKNLIKSRDLEDAKNLIEKYEEIVSNDLEIVLFKSQIAILMLKENNKIKSSLKLCLDNIKTEIKENISILVSNGDLQEGKALINEYKKIVHDDIESYSIESVILMMDGRLEKAEKILKEGLAKEDDNFDLLYNLGYLYEIKKKYVESLVLYKKALIKNYYQVNIEMINSKINDIKEKINSEVENEFGLCLSKTDNILFIDFDVNEKTHLIAEILNKYGISVDLAYANKSPISELTRYSNSYRKILGITDIDCLVEYSQYYDYNCVYVFNTPDEFKNYFKIKKMQVLDADLAQKTDKEIITYFSKNSVKLNNIHEYIKNEKISIMIPTYNRSYYLNRVLTFMNNYKYIKPRIIILDSSKESEKLQNENIIKKIENDNITYLHYTSEINFFEKLNNGLKIVDTEYVALCADDDFLSEEGVIESIKKLDEDKSLYSVKGKNLYFTYSMGNLFEYDWFEGLKQNSAMERLKEITKGFVPSLIYQVFRKNEFEKMYSFIEENMKQLPKNDTFSEYLFYFMVIATGKIDKINVDLNIRDKSVLREVEVKNFPHSLLDGSFNFNYEVFCDFLKKYFVFLEENIENFNKDIKEIFSEFLINFLIIPRENVEILNGKFNVEKLEQGMRKSWVWPSDL